MFPWKSKKGWEAPCESEMEEEEELPSWLPPPPKAQTQQPLVSISIGSPAPAQDSGLMVLEPLEDEDEEYTTDLDDYSKPNPLRALKALFGMS